MEYKFNSTTIPRRDNGTNLIRTYKIERKLFIFFAIIFVTLFAVLITDIFNSFSEKKIVNDKMNIFSLFVISILLLVSLVLNFLYNKVIN